MPCSSIYTWTDEEREYWSASVEARVAYAKERQAKREEKLRPPNLEDAWNAMAEMRQELEQLTKEYQSLFHSKKVVDKHLNGVTKYLCHVTGKLEPNNVAYKGDLGQEVYKWSLRHIEEDKKRTS